MYIDIYVFTYVHIFIFTYIRIYIYYVYKNLSGEASHISVTSGYLSQLATPLPQSGTGRDATGGAEEATRTAGGQNGGPTLEPFKVGKVAILTLKQNDT